MTLAYRTGLLHLGRPMWSRWLTVVNYHRVDDVSKPDFDSFEPNVSVTPDGFDRQMEYLARWFNVISVEDLTNWLSGRRDLPPYPALITFDDGYRDNFTKAYPILRRHGLPAIIFLTTEHIGTDKPFYWDLAAYCFRHTSRDRVQFPAGHVRHWDNLDGMRIVSMDWIETMKILPEREKSTWVARLPDLLNVSVPEGYFRRLMMEWDHVREMSQGGIGFGGHTLSHPILTRISFEDARAQIADSKTRIEEEIGKPALSFAYPNGMASDFNTAIENLVAEVGYRIAFTLLNGPSSLNEVKHNHYAIRRIFISPRYTIPKFAAHLSPLNRY